MTMEPPRSTRGLFTLDGRTPVAEPSVMQWGHWFERSEGSRQVASTSLIINDGEGKTLVSIDTLFTGLDMAFARAGRPGHKPMLFETATFYAEHVDVDRYSTWREAEAGHVATVKRIHEAIVRAEATDNPRASLLAQMMEHEA